MLTRRHGARLLPFLGGGEQVAEGRMRGGAANADARNPSPPTLSRGREREPARVAVPQAIPPNVIWNWYAWTVWRSGAAGERVQLCPEVLMLACQPKWSVPIAPHHPGSE